MNIRRIAHAITLIAMLFTSLSHALSINNQTRCVMRTEIQLNCQIIVLPRTPIPSNLNRNPYTIKWPSGTPPMRGSRLCVNMIPDCPNSPNITPIEVQIIHRPACLINLVKTDDGISAHLTDPCR